MHNGMAPFKFKIKASQARSIYHYKKLKIKVLKYNTDIFFNKQCLTKKIIPNYTNTKVPITSPAAYKTQNKAQNTQIKEEIKFLYKKKDKMNNSCTTTTNIQLLCIDGTLQ